MAYMDAGTGSMLVAMGLLWSGMFGLFIFGWIANIVAAIRTAKVGQNEQARFVLHIVGIFVSPLGSVMGVMWFFKWRKSDSAKRIPPPPPPPPTNNWAPPTA